MIQGDRVRFRPIEREDLPRLVAWLADPETRQQMAHHLPLSQVQEERWFEEMLQLPADEQPMGMDVEGDDGEWQPVGVASFSGIDWRNRAVELKILIGAAAGREQAVSIDGVATLVRHAFETLNLNRVWLRVYEDNLRAQRAYEKAGFFLEGHLRQADYRDGRYRDVLIYAITRDKWSTSRPK
jgi:RimJ/RimL family protein N-acetyltransferase